MVACLYFFVVAGVALHASEALAGALAGVSVANTAKVTVTTPAGTPAVRSSNTVAFTVAERLDVAVAASSKLTIGGGDTARALAFTLTNQGNGQEQFNLSAKVAAGAVFTPAIKAIVTDSDGDGRLTGADAVYSDASGGPLLAPGRTMTVWVVCDMPAVAPAGAEAAVTLSAAAATGSGAPGTVFPGRGDGGGDAVIGPNGAAASAQSAYVASGLTATIAKSQTASVAHPTAGSVVIYTLTASFAGVGTAAGAAVSDPIPPGSSYVPGSLRLDGAALTDAADGDSGRVDSNGVLVALGDVAAPAQHTVTFQVRVNPSIGSSQ